MNNRIVKIENFNIAAFRGFLDQNLMVNNEVIINFDKEMIKSVAITSSETCMKLWTVFMEGMLISAEDNQTIMDFDIEPEKPKVDNFDPFNVYVLKGDSFKRYLSVYAPKPVTLEFNVVDSDAADLTIYGESVAGTQLESKFILTESSYIKSQFSDYAAIIKAMSPTPDMKEIILSNDQIQEVKRLTKTLQKSDPRNTSYLTFEIIAEKKIVNIFDKVFKVTFPLSAIEGIMNPERDLSFKVLKADFMVIGNHTFSIYVKEGSEEGVILNTKYKNSLIAAILQQVSSVNNTDELTTEGDIDLNFDDVNMDDLFN